VLSADRERDGSMAIHQPREGLAVTSPMGIEVLKPKIIAES
jgi:hypothetical protein